MTFKQFSIQHPDLTVGQLRALWGKVSKALQSDMSTRFGGLQGATFKSASKVRIVDGVAQIALTATRRVPATLAEIEAAKQAESDASARRMGKLAECAAEARESKRMGLDLIALCKAQDSPQVEAIGQSA